MRRSVEARDYATRKNREFLQWVFLQNEPNKSLPFNIGST